MTNLALEIAERITNLAEQYNAEFGEAPLDTEWTETAYGDLTSVQQEQLTWAEFHRDIQEAR